MEVWLSSFQYHWCTFSVSGVNTSFMNGVGGPFCKVPNIHQCIIGQYYSVYSSVLSSQRSLLPWSIQWYAMACLSLVDRARAIEQIQAGSTTKLIVEFVSGVGQENVCLAIMQSITEHHWTVMGPAGENCWCHSHHLQDFRQIVVDEWNAKHSVFFLTCIHW